MSQPQDPSDAGMPHGSDPTDPDSAANNPFLNESMDDETADGDPADVGRHSVEGSGVVAAPATGVRRYLRRPPAWVLSAAAALVIGLVLGLVFFGGDEAPPEQTAQRPATTSAVPTPEGPITALAHVTPVQLMIPSIEVDSPLVNLGLNGDGTLEVPVDFAEAGWFTGGNYPGDPSGPPGLLAGHVDDYTGPAVFYELDTMVAGDEVMVVRADNTVAVFVVTATAQFPKDELPTDEIYAPVPDSQIVLITCTGSFDEAARSYDDNFVVRATLDMARSLEESNARFLDEVPAPAVDQINA